jgi:DNA-binding GntR family transcriptional regulator
MQLKQIIFQRKHEIIYSELRLAIMSGQFAPGQRLKLRALAAELGTSSMPVRDALGKLIAEQALVQADSGGASIPLATKRLVREVMESRALLEGEAAARAAQLMPPNEVARVRLIAEQLNQATKSRDILRYLKLNQALKFGIYAHCGSDVLRGLIESLWLRAGPFLRYLSRDLEGMIAINFHDEALDAIAARDSGRSHSSLSKDILAGMEFLLKNANFDEEVGA